MKKIYKVVYGDFMSQRTIGEFLSKSEITVFGLGGVGSYALEILTEYPDFF